MSEFIQFDTASAKVGGENVLQAMQSDKKLIFNESYTVMGGSLKAPAIYTCYDFVVIGNVEADDIDVQGNLLVTGNIKAKTLSCLKAITCGGKIEAEKILGNEIVAENISCNTLSCGGNVIIRSVIDVQDSITVDKSVMTGEGILGSGSFSAKNAVAAEFFEFDGEVRGKVLELATDAAFGEPHQSTGDDAIVVFSAQLAEVISSSLSAAGAVDEDTLIKTVAKISAIDENQIADWERLSKKLAELSYFDKITNFRDYLYIVMAKKLLPKEITDYETLSHLFGDMLADAEQKLDSMEFHAKTIEDIAYALKIISMCENDIKIDKDEAYDKILQKLGVKYKTAIKYLR